jgi:pimeloyl-ACP methyl ester carboxylesterase
MTKYGGGAYNKSQSIWSSVIIPILRSPEYSLFDLYRYAKGTFYSLEQLWEEVIATIKFDETVKKLEVPVYLTEGRHDQNTPPSLALKWFDELEAPHKEWAWFEYSGHSPIEEEPELWGKTMREMLFTKS